ncbi:MAG TPA: leucyl aminopeptidase [Sphingobacteriaceae bacterium]|nr:leucyl aminopeptidase [Sphingobacteriaceae bacterium]
MKTAMRLEHGLVTEVQCDALVVNLFKGVTEPGGATGAVDQALDGAISEAIARGEFTGKLYETLVLPTFGRLPARRVIVVGLGPREGFNAHRARNVAAAAARRARQGAARAVATIVHGAGIGGMEPAAAAQALAEGTFLGLYRFDKYRQGKGLPEQPEEVVVIEADAGRLPLFKEGLARGQITAAATNLARDLTNEPPSRLTPTRLAEKARELAASAGLEIEVMNGRRLEELGIHAVLAVGRGSDEPPVMMVLRYRGRGGDGFDVGLVGKGVTFDSGGLSLKPAGGMESMKYDMAGAAAVLGAMKIIAAWKPSLDVVAVIPAVENLPSGHALKPGDIIDTFDGKTIEIMNTDAEGRLILADAIAYARHLGARRIVDVATLTGAARIALGPAAAALVSNDDQLADQVLQAAERSGELLWRLPSWDEYRELYKSQVADLKNTAGRDGGTITGALIVGEFAGDTPWAHLDIAPTAWLDKGKPYGDAGATGVMVRTLAQLVMDLAAAG